MTFFARASGIKPGVRCVLAIMSTYLLSTASCEGQTDEGKQYQGNPVLPEPMNLQ